MERLKIYRLNTECNVPRGTELHANGIKRVVKEVGGKFHFKTRSRVPIVAAVDLHYNNNRIE